MLPLQLIALSDSETSPGQFVVILENNETGKQLPIIIGAFEAQAIAMFMEQLQSPRPLTHDLFHQTLLALNCQLAEVQIQAMVNGSFVSCLLLHTAEGKKLRMDARTSDALALALRFGAPICIDKQLFKQHSLVEPTPKNSIRGSLWQYSLAELELLLADLLRKEDYESASKVRDILHKKSGRKD